MDGSWQELTKNLDCMRFGEFVKRAGVVGRNTIVALPGGHEIGARRGGTLLCLGRWEAGRGTRRSRAEELRLALCGQLRHWNQATLAVKKDVKS